MTGVRGDAEWMKRALELADQAMQKGEVPVGALLVLDDECVGEAHNAPIFSTDPSAHAEILALRRAAERLGNYRLNGTTLYCTVEPCAMCAGALVHARVQRLVYAADEPRTGAVVSTARLLDNPSSNHRVVYAGGLMAEKAAALMQAFFRQRRAK